MSTEVGSLQASLTLDLSDFRAGMTEAANLASQLSQQLQTALSGNIGFTTMAREVSELIAQMQNLSGEVSAFQAAMNTMSSADVFATMRTHTAALPSEIASITSALQAANEEAFTLAEIFEYARTSASNLASAIHTVDLGSLTTGAGVLDFSNALGQLTQMHTLMSQLITQIQQFNTIDLNTGELMGDGSQMPAFLNLQQILQEIAAILERITGLLAQCNDLTEDWARQMAQVQGNAERIAASLSGASTSMRSMRTGANGAASGARNLASQTGKAEKNLQSAKGAALSVKGILGGIVISQAFYTLLNIMEELVRGSLEFSQNMQDASVAFEYLMRGQEVSSGAFLNALKDIALQSPLDTTDLTSASRKLMAMGFSAKATVPTLQILTDTAAVFSNGAGDMADMIDHISLAFGQMIASGKVSAQELRQLYNAGLPIYDLLADGLGITKEMAKNIGHYNIDSATAVYAILEQLQQRYSGAAADMAMTMSGSMEVIRESIQQLISYGWADIFDDITLKLNKIARFMQALVKITHAYGPGGLFQAIFPESMWGILRNLVGGFQMLGYAAKQAGSILVEAFGGGLRIIATIASYVIPVIATIANTILYIARMALAASPALRMLLAAMAALVIAVIIGKAIAFLAKAIYLLSGAKYAVAALVGLAKAMAALTGLPLKVVVPLMAVAAALLAIVASSEKARAALAKFFGGISDSFNSFAQKLDFGFDPGEILTPEFEAPDTSDWNSGIEDMVDGMEELDKATEEAGKSAKKNLQSFDEVYTIDPNQGADANDPFKDMLESIKGLGDLDFSNMFDWTGDWATDWGELTAGLGDLGDMTGDIFGDMSKLAENMWQALAEAFAANPEFAGGLIGAAIGAVIGGLFGGKGGALIGAALGLLAGSIAGSFWPEVSAAIEKFGWDSSNLLSGSIGAILGAAIGGKIGGLKGAGIGAAIGALCGWIIDEIREGLTTGDWTGIAQPIGMGLGTAIGYVIGGPTGAAVGFAIGNLVGWIADLFIQGFTTGNWDISSISTSIGGGLGAAIGWIAGGPAGAMIGTAIGALVGWITGQFIMADWTAVREAFLQPFRDFGLRAQELFNSIWEPIKTAFDEGDWMSLGTAITHGIFEGILGAVDLVFDVIFTFFEAIWNALCEIFGIHSPAESMLPIGEFIILGILQGILNIMSTITAWLTANVFTPVKTWFANNFTLQSFVQNGKNVIQGFINGARSVAQTIQSWFTNNVYNPLKSWFGSHLNIGNFLQFGKNIIQGIINGVQSLASKLWETVRNICTSVSNTIRSAFRIHSPSKVTTEFGVYIDQGLINGMLSKVRALKDAAIKVSDAVKDNLLRQVTMDIEAQPIIKAAEVSKVADDTLYSVAELVDGQLSQIPGIVDGQLNKIPSLLDTQFGQIPGLIDNQLGQIPSLLDGQLNRIPNLIDDNLRKIPDLIDRNLSKIPGLIDNQLSKVPAMISQLLKDVEAASILPSGMGSINAADDMLADARSRNTPGASDVMRVIAEFTEDTLEKLSNRLAMRIYEYLAPLFAQMSPADQDRVLAYIGTLIADDVGLKELERKLKIIQISEGRRG